MAYVGHPPKLGFWGRGVFSYVAVAVGVGEDDASRHFPVRPAAASWAILLGPTFFFVASTPPTQLRGKVSTKQGPTVSTGVLEIWYFGKNKFEEMAVSNFKGAVSSPQDGGLFAAFVSQSWLLLWESGPRGRTCLFSKALPAVFF